MVYSLDFAHLHTRTLFATFRRSFEMLVLPMLVFQTIHRFPRNSCPTSGRFDMHSCYSTCLIMLCSTQVVQLLRAWKRPVQCQWATQNPREGRLTLYLS